MRTIFAEYNPKRNSIDVYTSAGYMLRIDCWEAEKNWDSILKVDSSQLVNCPLFLIIFSFFPPVFHLTSDSNINHILRQ